MEEEGDEGKVRPEKIHNKGKKYLIFHNGGEYVEREVQFVNEVEEGGVCSSSTCSSSIPPPDEV